MRMCNLCAAQLQIGHGVYANMGTPKDTQIEIRPCRLLERGPGLAARASLFRRLLRQHGEPAQKT
jgi:hypothetical protein